MLAVPMTLLLQASALAQASAGTNTLPHAQGITVHEHSDVLALWEKVDFYFPGGTPKQFLDSVDKQYKVDWSSIADIPPEMQNVHIPALRLNRESVDRILPNRGRGGMRGLRGGGGGAGGPFFGMEAEELNPLDALVALYNSLWEARTDLGHLIVEGGMVKPSIVIFRAPNPNAPIDLKLKAFALKGFPEAEWDKLAQELGNQFKLLDQLNHEDAANRPRTDVAIHRDAGLLIVSGPQSYVEVAESLVHAWDENDRRQPLDDASRGDHPGGEKSHSEPPVPAVK
jgi:hypothetical protein